MVQRALLEHVQAEVVGIGAATLAARSGADQHILEDRHATKRARDLVRAGDAELAPVGGAPGGDVAAVEDDAAAVRRERA